MGSDRHQGVLDRAAPLEDHRDLSRRDAGASPVRQPEVRLAERHRRTVADFEMPIRLDEADHDPQGILDDVRVPKDDWPKRAPRHPVTTTAAVRRAVDRVDCGDRHEANRPRSNADHLGISADARCPQAELWAESSPIHPTSSRIRRSRSSTRRTSSCVRPAMCLASDARSPSLLVRPTCAVFDPRHSRAPRRAGRLAEEERAIEQLETEFRALRRCCAGNGSGIAARADLGHI